MTDPTGSASNISPDVFRTQTFAHTAVGLLREMILSGGLGPGERLNELAIAEQFKISRSPIREAIRALAGEGLVRFVPGRGAYVMEFDIESVKQVSEVRIALEARAAMLAAERITPAQLAEIRGVLASTEQAIRKGTIEERLETTDQALKTGATYPSDLDFHTAVVASTGNPRLSAAVVEVATQFRLARARVGREPQWAPIAYAEHEEILQAIERRDPLAASQAMETHLSNSINRLIEHLEGEGTRH